jgi:hypothetical protein
MVGVAYWESISYAVDGWADKFRVCLVAGEGHKLGLYGISLKAVFMKPGEDCFIFGSSRLGGGFEGGEDGIDGPIVDIEEKVSISPGFRYLYQK